MACQLLAFGRAIALRQYQPQHAISPQSPDSKSGNHCRIEPAAQPNDHPFAAKILYRVADEGGQAGYYICWLDTQLFQERRLPP